MRTGFFILGASLGAALLAPSTPALATGVVTGTIHIAAPAPKIAPHPVVKDGSVCGREAANESVVVGKSGCLRNVVVFANDVPFAGAPAPIAGATLDQKKCRYAPHVQALTVGTPLSLMNNDAVLHNVHANSDNMTVFNVAMPIKGQKLPIPMRKAGLMKLQCDAGHTWMNGWILRLRSSVLRSHRRCRPLHDQGSAGRRAHLGAVARAGRRQRRRRADDHQGDRPRRRRGAGRAHHEALTAPPSSDREP